jgi:hypothetical protein
MEGGVATGSAADVIIHLTVPGSQYKPSQQATGQLRDGEIGSTLGISK